MRYRAMVFSTNERERRFRGEKTIGPSQPVLKDIALLRAKKMGDNGLQVLYDDRPNPVISIESKWKVTVSGNMLLFATYSNNKWVSDTTLICAVNDDNATHFDTLVETLRSLQPAAPGAYTAQKVKETAEKQQEEAFQESNSMSTTTPDQIPVYMWYLKDSEWLQGFLHNTPYKAYFREGILYVNNILVSKDDEKSFYHV